MSPWGYNATMTEPRTSSLTAKTILLLILVAIVTPIVVTFVQIAIFGKTNIAITGAVVVAIVVGIVLGARRKQTG